jgi:mycothiol synthase
VAEVVRRVSRHAVDPAQLEHDVASDPDVGFFVAHIGPDVVGSGVAKRSSVPDTVFAMVRVVPEHRRRGVGTALYAAVSDHAGALKSSEVWGRVSEDDGESLEFFRKRGFREMGRECEVVLTLARAPHDRLSPPEGVVIVSLAERPDLIAGAYEVEREALPDVPVPQRLAAAPFERWRAGNIDGPGALPAGSFVALADGEVVGYAGLHRLADEGAAEHLLTGVRGAWRSRGIATALKRAQIAWARNAGFERLVTSNDEANLAMRGINARLGYEPLPGFIQIRGPLARF